jgi:hypothetical protein
MQRGLAHEFAHLIYLPFDIFFFVQSFQNLCGLCGMPSQFLIPNSKLPFRVYIMSERRIEMTLQEELNALKARSEARIPEEKRAIMHRATEELEKSGLKEKVLKVGDRAPDFSLKDTQGSLVSLGSLLERGPVVLSFYRGGW